MLAAAQLGNGAQTATQLVSTGGSVATAILPAVTHAAWAVPVVGTAVAGVAVALSLIFGRKGPRQKEEASRIADDAEQQLQANVRAYLGGPRTAESQAAALANFDYAWSQLVAIWQQLGEPGERAIRERGRDGRPAWGPNWFELYRDPIATGWRHGWRAAAIDNRRGRYCRGI
jgi:hypothetical protein